MKITAIKQQIKNPDRVSIFLDGKYSVSLTLNELLEEKIKVSTEIDEKRLKNLQKKSVDGKLRMRTLEWLLNRPHSERELRDYLRRKQAEPDMVESLVSEMQTKKYQDDRVFARWFVDLRIRKLKSTRAITAELRAKGVAADVISQSLNEGSGDEKQRLQDIVKKKQRSARYQDREKLTAYLIRQGYSYDLVKDVLDGI